MRPPARWTLSPAPAGEIVRAIASELHLPLDVCRLLVIRGYKTVDVAKTFLRPRLDGLHDGSRLLGMDAAVARLERAIRDREMVMVHGDYDVDGICATSLLTRVIRDLGGQVTPFIPRRIEDGYDLSDAGVAAAVALKAKLVVTCDCGTTAVKAVRKLGENGIDVIVTDHHLTRAGELPECLALLNPRQPACTYLDKDLAGVGIAFKLARELARKMLGESGDARVFRQLDLVALATVADLVPLRGENRILVRAGLRMMRQTENIGLRALIRAAGLAEKPITAGRVGFVLAPRLNALGRIHHAMRGVELLLATNEHEANAIARECEELNRERQDLDRATFDVAYEMLGTRCEDGLCGVVLSSESWHPGVIGIVASRIVEATGRPTVLISVAGDVGKGSGRSIPGFDLHGGLAECADLLVRFGGHKAAAGVTIDPTQIAAFAAKFDDVVRARVKPEDFLPEIRVDLEVDLASANFEELEKLQRHFEPFGQGNPGPVYLSKRVKVSRQPRKIGENGIRLTVASGEKRFELVAWDLLQRRDELEEGLAIDVVYKIERDEWNGMIRVQGRLLDFRRS